MLKRNSRQITLNWNTPNISIYILPKEWLWGALLHQSMQPEKEFLPTTGVFVKVCIVCNCFPAIP